MMDRLERRWRCSVSTPAMPKSWKLILLSVALLFGSQASAYLTQQYCSSENTGSSQDPTFLKWQSNGACSTNCKNAGYSVAVVQGYDCWCSNYLPADQVSVTDNCDQVCPGFGYEHCGSQSGGVYGYLVVGIPSGTAGASSASQTQSPESTSSSSSSSSSSSETSSPDPTTTTATPSPLTSVEVVTVSNQATTQTVTSTPTVAPADNNQQAIKSKSVSGGLIAGVVVAAVVAAICLGLLVFWCWYRRKRDHELEAGVGAVGAVGSGNNSNRPTRNTSVLSRQGLLEKVYPSAIITSRNNNNNANPSMTETGGGVSPISERRRSQPLFYDQRLNPTTLMDFDNGSRVSVNTLPDNRDFSRTLNVTNPDLRRGDWE